MTDRPILFSAPMIKALLADRKTQTRRLVNPQPFADGYQAEEAYAAQKAAEARALAAEAERDALRDALAEAIAAFPHIRDEQTQKALNVLRALTEKNNG